MTASNIKVFLRVRPSAKPSSGFQVNSDQGSVSFELEKNTPDYEVNNLKTSHSFRFDGVLGMKTTQEDMLNIVAKPVIQDVLNGVNGTIFAYGQTGSGKTFTVTGGAERYADRGLIPRTIQYMFEAFRKGDAQYQMYISYLEIYQDTGYDLLRDDSATKLADLPKVQLREDEDGNMHLRNLSVNLASSEEDALNLLFMGDTNRVVAETPMNDASTRSHCLFIIWIDSTKPGSDVVRRSKLHLVDLAGSERVSQTGVTGKLLNEAKAINLSLHYLERVIVALHSRSKGVQAHVPYRDSMMTSVLRDSLGGNCRTTMIGCIASEASNVNESISTCRFAQRVAQITNSAKVNEELDPNLLIARLKREVAELKEEVRIARMNKDGNEPEALTEEGLEQCRALVLQFVQKGVNPDEPFMCGSIERLRASFRILRDMCRGVAVTEGGKSLGDGPNPDSGHRKAALEAEAKKLQLEIAQRDQEIAVMVQMLSKQRGTEPRTFIANGSAKTVPSNVTAQTPETLVSAVVDLAPATTTNLKARQEEAPILASGAATEHAGHEASKAKLAARSEDRRGGRPVATMPASAEAAALLLDKEKALEVFRQTVYKPPQAFEENKGLLKEKISQAKILGDEANQVRAGINSAKTRLEKLRTERAMTAAGYDDTPLEDGPEELAEVQQIERLKAIYRDRTASLRQVKSDVEGIQRLLEQNKVRMQREFETWFSGLRSRASLSSIEEDKKRELYEKVTSLASTGGSSASTPKATGTASLQATLAASGNAAADTPRTAAGKLSKSPGNMRTEEEIAAYYAALGELSRRA